MKRRLVDQSERRARLARQADANKRAALGWYEEDDAARMTHSTDPRLAVKPADNPRRFDPYFDAQPAKPAPGAPEWVNAALLLIAFVVPLAVIAINALN
jgi:hypothetical protein